MENSVRVPHSIPREDLAALPLARYEGEIVVVSTAQQLARATADMRDETVVGFDTETRPAFRKGESYLPCLVQVATAAAVYIFPLRHVESHPLLAECLASPHIVKAGIGIHRDLAELQQVFAAGNQRIVDLGTIAKRHGAGQTGLRNLAGMFLKLRIPKGAKTTNWAAPTLSSAQIAYAATDAWACRELYLQFERMGLLTAGKPAVP